MKELAGLFVLISFLFIFHCGSAELISAEDCRLWLAEFEREIQLNAPESIVTLPNDPETEMEFYDFGVVKKRNRQVISIALRAPAMADCRDGYVGMKFDLIEGEQAFPVRTGKLSRDPPSVFWVYADETGPYAAEWIAMEGSKIYTLTYLLNDGSSIQEIRFRLDDADEMMQKDLLDVAEQL